jgi:hypothetical protein
VIGKVQACAGRGGLAEKAVRRKAVTEAKQGLAEVVGMQARGITEEQEISARQWLCMCADICALMVGLTEVALYCMHVNAHVTLAGHVQNMYVGLQNHSA